MNEKVVVAVCTHNRKQHLLQTIKAFNKIKRKNFKLAIIDSSDQELIKNEKKGIDFYLHMPDKKPLSIKRNIAINKIDSSLILFTDDDCIPSKNWVNEITSPFKDDRVMCVTGKTIPSEEFKKSNYERIFTFDNLGNNKREIIKHFGLHNLWKVGHGNNMAFRTSVFKEIRLFDESLGVGSPINAGEDVDMFYRIYKKGHKIIFNPNAIIIHKHISKDDNLIVWARKNTYASNKVLLKNIDFNTFVIFLGGILKLSLQTISAFIKKDPLKGKVKFNSLIGWIGIK
ncbi:MAG: glycosyltransferase [archaeon]